VLLKYIFKCKDHKTQDEDHVADVMGSQISHSDSWSSPMCYVYLTYLSTSHHWYTFDNKLSLYCALYNHLNRACSFWEGNSYPMPFSKVTVSDSNALMRHVVMAEHDLCLQEECKSALPLNLVDDLNSFWSLSSGTIS
jgi:hypothetical protein